MKKVGVLVLLLAIAAMLATFGAGWKWGHGQARLAGWSWDDGATSSVWVD